MLFLFAVLTVYVSTATSLHAETLTKRPLGWIAIALVPAGIAFQQLRARRKDDRGAFIGATAALAGFVGIWTVGTFPAIVPALDGSGSGLTAGNASAGSGTLWVMVVVAAIGVPLVAASVLVVYRIFRGRVDDVGEGY